MGFYLRKSVKAGPFRVNLSKSGIGVSAGVPGFRVGHGPRGSYVHVGRNGVYYRRSLGGSQQVRKQATPRPVFEPINTSAVVMQDVQGATVLQLAASNVSELIDDLNDAARRSRLSLFAWLRGKKSVAVFYDVNDDSAARFENLVNAFQIVRGCVRVWHIASSGAVHDSYTWKVNAGASNLLNRTPLALVDEPPKVLATNIVVPALQSKTRAVYLLPDQLLVKEGKRFAGIKYTDLKSSFQPTRFIEEERVPSDSRQVGSTWKYVNKKGGPDRRFNNNRQLPIMQYGQLELMSPGGFRMLLQFSSLEKASAFADAIDRMNS